jgi:hypothetical protein
LDGLKEPGQPASARDKDERKHSCGTEGCTNVTWYEYCRECNFEYSKERAQRKQEWEKRQKQREVRREEIAKRPWVACVQSGCQGKTQREYCKGCWDAQRDYVRRDCRGCGRSHAGNCRTSAAVSAPVEEDVAEKENDQEMMTV